MTTFPITGTTRFDDHNRLPPEQRLPLPRDRLKPGLSLDTTLAYRLAALYFTTLERSIRPLIRVEVDQDGIQVITRGRGMALHFGVGALELDESRTAIRWPIRGGWALDGSVPDGGTFSVGL